MTRITIALVDDHRVVARSLQSYLESWPDLHVVGIAANGEALLRHLSEWTPQIVIQDLVLPGGLDGIDTTRRIRERAPNVRVIALTATTDEARLIAVLRAGASGYVRKDADPEILLAAVHTVATGKVYIDPSVVAPQSRAVPQEDLTVRELDVLRQLAIGCQNREIAEKLGIGDETVKTHISNVLAKLQVENRSLAIVQALTRGLVSLDELQQV
jgi:NarL family two-component system response regulator LiaR